MAILCLGLAVVFCVLQIPSALSRHAPTQTLASTNRRRQDGRHIGHKLFQLCLEHCTKPASGIRNVAVGRLTNVVGAGMLQQKNSVGPMQAAHKADDMFSKPHLGCCFEYLQNKCHVGHIASNGSCCVSWCGFLEGESCFTCY